MEIRFKCGLIKLLAILIASYRFGDATQATKHVLQWQIKWIHNKIAFRYDTVAILILSAFVCIYMDDRICFPHSIDTYIFF